MPSENSLTPHLTAPRRSPTRRVLPSPASLVPANPKRHGVTSYLQALVQATTSSEDAFGCGASRVGASEFISVPSPWRLPLQGPSRTSQPHICRYLVPSENQEQAIHFLSPSLGFSICETDSNANLPPSLRGLGEMTQGGCPARGEARPLRPGAWGGGQMAGASGMGRQIWGSQLVGAEEIPFASSVKGTPGQMCRHGRGIGRPTVRSESRKYQNRTRSQRGQMMLVAGRAPR